MKRSILAIASALLIGCTTSPAWADYVVIVANLGEGGVRLNTVGNALGGAIGGQGAIGVPPGGGFGRGGAIGGGPGALGGAGALGRPGGAGFNGAPPGFGALGGAGAIGAVPPPPAEFDIDKLPLMIVAVVEVERPLGTLDTIKLARGSSIFVKHKVGGPDGKVYLANTPISTVTFLHPDKKPVAPLIKVYEQKLAQLKDPKTAATAENWIEFAEWALNRGLLAQFKEQMDKLVETDKRNPKVAAYIQTKAALARATAATDTASPWRAKLLGSQYQTKSSPHYLLLNNDPAAAETRLQRLESAFEAFYYWFALHGMQLQIPKEKLVAILTNDPKDFKRIHSTLDSTPIVSDAFYAPREGLAVFSAKRLDEGYDRLEKFAAPLWGQGYSREMLLKNKGFPKSALAQPQDVWEAMTLALLLKVLEQDSEIAGTSHIGTRQLVYASGLLPTTVSAPEWVQFGVGGSFETAPGSPWATVGLPSFVYLPVYRDMLKEKKLPANHLELLRKIVTDDYFRNPAPGLDKDAAKRRARATAWALGWFLVTKERDGLMRYFQELSRMPRDMALDEGMLWTAFARAFNAIDANGQVDEPVLQELVNRWDKALMLDVNDSRETQLMSEITKAFKDAAVKALTPPPNQNQVPGRGPGGFPPGGPRGPGGGKPPGGT